MRSLSLCLLTTAALLVARPSLAERELLTQAGEAGTIAFDQLAGLRANSTGGFGFTGPLGVLYQSAYIDATPSSPAVSTRSVSFFVAPSLDVFVVDKLSVGGIVQFSWQNPSMTVHGPAGTKLDIDRPSTLGFSIVPRIGYMLRVSDRFAIWPRAGAGYASNQSLDATGRKQSHSALLLEADVGFLYRLNEAFYLRLTPALTLSPVGSTSVDSSSAESTFLAFSSTLGFGVFW